LLVQVATTTSISSQGAEEEVQLRASSADEAATYEKPSEKRVRGERRKQFAGPQAGA
jgi:hypothetical protein